MATDARHRVVANYQLEETLGRGAMGIVHLATDTRTGQRVAVKILHPHLTGEEREVRRFIQERKAFNLVEHQNVVRVIELIADGDQLAIVMELVEGGDLKKLKDDLRRSPSTIVRVISDVADGLATIHLKGIVHRDLKPANILVAQAADGLVPKIADFGLAHVVDEALTQSSAAIGTPLYMAPESAEKAAEVKEPADVYALGAILFELLVGEPPFHGGGTMAVLRAHSQDPPPIVAGVPDALGALIQEMLAKDPLARPDATQVRDRLRRLLPAVDDSSLPTAIPADAAPLVLAAAADQSFAGPGPGETPLTGTETTVSWLDTLTETTSRHWLKGLTVAASVALVAIAGYFMLSERPSGADASVVTEYAFAPRVLDDGAVVTRKWQFNDDGSILTGSVKIHSSEQETIAAEHFEVLPAAFAAEGSQVDFEPSPDRQPEDLVASYLIESLETGDSFSFVYDVALPADGNSFARLERFALDQIEAERLFYADRQLEQPGTIVELASIGLAPDRIVVSVGDRRELTLSGQLSDGAAAPDVALAEAGWQSSDPAVAIVEGGVVTAQAVGTTTIVAQLGSMSAETTVVVEADDSSEVADADSGLVSTSVGSTPGSGPGTTSGPDPTTSSSTSSSTTTSSTSTTTTTTTTTTQPPTSSAIQIVSGPTVSARGTNTFSFTFSTNDVCGAVSFRIIKDGVQQYGDSPQQSQCSSSYSQSSTRVAAGLEQGTTYTVEVTVFGRGSDGTTPAGTGSDTASFTVTTDQPETAEPEPVAIIGGPTVTGTSSNSIQFALTTNNVCSSMSFTFTGPEGVASVHNGDGGCFGPNHSGNSAWHGFELQPGTTYTVNVSVRGTTGSGTEGTGTVSTSFTASTQ